MQFHPFVNTCICNSRLRQKIAAPKNQVQQHRVKATQMIPFQAKVQTLKDLF
jgi:hypothetical protein